MGLCAYNRPIQLRIALDSILKQTYTNLEIIISDNCSPNSDVRKVCEEYAIIDKRIRYYRQSKNIGASENFRFVLNKANGKYFMWAADDDLRHNTTVDQYIKWIGLSGGVFSSYDLYDYDAKDRKEMSVVKLNGVPYLKSQLINYQNRPCPSMVYGLFLTSAAKESFPRTPYDFWDISFCQKIIWRYGIKTFESIPLYTAGYNKTYRLNPIKKYFNPIGYICDSFSVLKNLGFLVFIFYAKFIKWTIVLNLKILTKKNWLD